MAKNNKGTKNGAAAAAASIEAGGKKENQNNNSNSENKVAVIQLGDLDKLAQQRALAGLDPNHAEDLIARLDDRFYKDPDAAKKHNISPETVGAINEITGRAMVALLANEVELAQTPFAVRMRASSLEQIRICGAAMHVNIDTKALPAPDENGTVVVPSTAIKVDPEAKQGLAEERAAASEKVELDPTKIASEDDLKKSLLSILVKGTGDTSLYGKLMAAINFYHSYLSVKANKAEDAESAKKEVESKTNVDFLSDIASLLGKCTFTTNSIAKYLFEETERTKSPVVAFCAFREASLNKKTGMPQIEDQAVADFVKVLIRWYANTEVEETKKQIEGFERDLELLKKDAKKNAKGIESGNKVIENAKKHIEAVNQVVTYVNMPDRKIADEFAEDFKDSSRENYKFARMMGSKILKTYYNETATKNYDQENLIHNLQQYVGIITNLFLPPLNKISNYSEANITELQKVEGAAEEPKNE